MPNKTYASMDYNSLFLQIQNYANRDVGDVDFENAIPYFIFQAQQRIWREAKDIGFEVHTLQAQFIPNLPVIRKPSNWNKTISIIYGDTISAYNNSRILEMHTYEYCRAYWPNTVNDTTGKNPPLYYSDTQFNYGNNTINNLLPNIDDTPYSAWYISPTPALAYYYQITYLGSVVNITSNYTQNILTIKFPDVLFYASMCEAFSYTQETERTQVFENLYARGLESLNAQTQERYTDRTSKRNKD